MDPVPPGQRAAMQLYMSRLAQGPSASHTTAAELGVEWRARVEDEVATRGGQSVTAEDFIIGASELLALAVYTAETMGLDPAEFTQKLGALLAQTDV